MAGVQLSEIGRKYHVGIGYVPPDGVTSVTMLGYQLADGAVWEETTDVTDDQHLVDIGSPNSTDRFGRYPVISQGDWSGGEQQKYFTDPTKFYSSDGNLDTTRPGLLQIAGIMQTVALPAGFTTASPEAETWGRNNTDVLGSGASFNVARVTSGTATGVLVSASAANVPIAMVEAQGGPFYLVADGIYTSGGKLAGSVTGQIGLAYFGGLLYYWQNNSPASLRSNNNAGTDTVVTTLPSFETPAGILGGPDGVYYWTYTNKEALVYRFDGANSQLVGRINGQVLKARTALGSVYLLALLIQPTLPAQQQQQTFSFTGGSQSFTVPASITSITVVANGAQGGNSGGLGARIQGTVAVAPGDVWTIVVGGQGASPSGSSGAAGGFGAAPGGPGGAGGVGTLGTASGGAGGGGATGVSTATVTRAIVAAGGGGGSNGGASSTAGTAGSGNFDAGGGAGGGAGTAVAGGAGGTGGSAGSGGAAGGSGTNGASLLGGTGGAGAASVGSPTGSGGGPGGGGGFFGGGGGGAGGTTHSRGGAGSGGGGGGSNHVDASVSGATVTDGAQPGNGSVTLYWTPPLANTPLNYTLYQLSGSSLVLLDDERVALPDFQPAANGNILTHVGMDSDERFVYVYWPGNNPGGTAGYGVRAYDAQGNKFKAVPTPLQANTSPGGAATSANQNGLVTVMVSNNATTIQQRSNATLAPSGTLVTSYFDAGVPLVGKRWLSIEFVLDGLMPPGGSIQVALQGDQQSGFSSSTTAVPTGNTWTAFFAPNTILNRLRLQIVLTLGSNNVSPVVSYYTLRYDLGRVWKGTLSCADRERYLDGSEGVSRGQDLLANIENILKLSGGNCELFVPSPTQSGGGEQVNAKLIDYNKRSLNPGPSEAQNTGTSMQADVEVTFVESL